MKHNKAQISLEFFALNGFLLLTFIGLLLIVQQRSIQIQQESLVRGEQAVSEVLLREIRYAYIAGHGYSRDFELPRTVRGLPYEVTIINSPPGSALKASTLAVRYKDRSDVPTYSLSVPHNVILADLTTLDPDPPGPLIVNSYGTIRMYLPSWVILK